MTHTDRLSHLLLAMPHAERPVPAKPEPLILSERDSLLVLAALENPPVPTVRLLVAAYALPMAVTQDAFDNEGLDFSDW